MIGNGMGPEDFLTRQASFVLHRVIDMRRSNQFELAREMESIHIDLLRRLNECLSPEGFAEQYLWTLKEADNIREVYEDFYRRQGEMQAGMDGSQNEPEPFLDEMDDTTETRNPYRGSLSECSDPDGWIDAMYGDGSSESFEVLHPAVL